MIVCQASPFGDSGRFISTTDTIGAIENSGNNSTTNFGILGTFLFRTISSGVLVAFGNCDLLRRL